MSYLPNEQHRNGNPEKSQWTISLDDELASFFQAEERGWQESNKAWGLHLVEGRIIYLGVTKNRQTPVFIAKYTCSRDAVWHGYPADYRNNSQDIPTPRENGT